MTSKPDWCPQDIWAAADEALDLMLCNCIEASGSTDQLRADSTEPLARSILNERERCAKIAETADRPGRNTGSLIAAAIRKTE